MLVNGSMFGESSQGHVTRCRWTGPGLEVLQSGHTAWVSMRAWLLKCNSDQASHDEAKGLETLKTSGPRAGAVDVASEGVTSN